MPGMSSTLPARAALPHGCQPQVSLDNGLTVASFGREVEMLHTRTRPKKVLLLASNGQRCSFLLKVSFSLDSSFGPPGREHWSEGGDAFARPCAGP